MYGWLDLGLILTTAVQNAVASVSIALMVDLRRPYLFVMTHTLTCALAEFVITRILALPMAAKVPLMLLPFLGIPVLFGQKPRLRALLATVLLYFPMAISDLAVSLLYQIVSGAQPAALVYGDHMTIILVRLLSIPIFTMLILPAVLLWRRLVRGALGDWTKPLLATIVSQSAVVVALDAVTIYTYGTSAATVLITAAAIGISVLGNMAAYRVSRQLIRQQMEVERRLWAEQRSAAR